MYIPLSYPFDLNKNEASTPKTIAAEIPALVTSKIPVMTPINPCTSASCNAPCTKEFPKLVRSEEHTSELQSRFDLVCRLLLEKKKKSIHIESNKTRTVMDH